MKVEMRRMDLLKKLEQRIEALEYYLREVSRKVIAELKAEKRIAVFYSTKDLDGFIKEARKR